MKKMVLEEQENSRATDCFIAPENLPHDLLDAPFLSVPRHRIHLKLVYKNNRLFLAVTAHNREILKEWLKGIEGYSCEVLCG